MAKNLSTNTPTTMEELLASRYARSKLLKIYRGQQVEGEVLSINDKEITLEIGAKSEGILPSRSIPAEKLSELKIGDKLKAYVEVVENENGQTTLSLTYQIKPSGFKGRGVNWARFIQAQTQKSKLSGKVLEINKGGLIVDIEGSRGFLPNSQVGFELLSKASKGMEDTIGQTITVTVSEIDQNNNKLIFTQRGQVSDEVRNKLENFKKDTKVQGRIVAILPFGLVVDIDPSGALGTGGVEGLVFISDVSWERQADLTRLYSVGDKVDVLVIGIDKELGRLNLSIKQLSEDPFAKLAENYPADEVVKGEVVSLSEAGVVFKFKDGVEGLLPSSKMEPGVTYEAGKSMSVLVDSVDMQRRRVDLAPFITSTEGLIYK